MPADVSHQRGTAGHGFCDSFGDGGADGAFGLFIEPVKPATALLKDIGEAGKHNNFTEEVGVGVITVAEGHDRSQPSGCLLGEGVFIRMDYVEDYNDKSSFYEYKQRAEMYAQSLINELRKAQ